MKKETDMKINITCDLTDHSCSVNIGYAGCATPVEFDRALLSIITTIAEVRNKEIKKRSGSSTGFDVSEYTKR